MLLRLFLVGVGAAVFGSGCGEGFQSTESSTSSATNTGGSGGSGGSTGGAGGETAASGGAGGGVDPIVIVQATQTKISPGVEDVPTLSWSTPPAEGNSVIVGITCFSDVDNCTIPQGGVTDNHGNEYRLAIAGDSIISQPTHGARGFLFIAENVAVGADSFTISVDPNGTVPPATQNMVWGAIEVSGLAPDSLDQTGLFPAAGEISSTTVETSDATAQGNELAVAVHTMRSNDADVAYAHEPGWTQHHVNSNGASAVNAHSMVSRVVAEAGTVSHTWTHDVPTRGAAAIIATFKGR